jgi:predicted anti-sigma-YlaC factor YlaD
MSVGQAQIDEWREHHLAWRRLSSFLDADRPGQDLERVAHHVDHCAECGPTLEELARVVERLATLRRDPPASIVVETVRWLQEQWQRDRRWRAGRVG